MINPPERGSAAARPNVRLQLSGAGTERPFAPHHQILACVRWVWVAESWEREYDTSHKS